MESSMVAVGERPEQHGPAGRRRWRLPGLSLRVRAFIILALGLITVSRLVGFAVSEDAALRGDTRELELARQIQLDDQDLRLSLAEQDIYLGAYLISANPERLADYDQTVQASAVLRARLASEIPPGGLRTQFAQVDSAARDWQGWAEAERGAVRARGAPATLAEVETGNRLLAAYRSADRGFSQALRDGVSQMSARTLAQQRYDYLAIMACAAVIALTLLLLSYLVILAVVKPISRLAGQARELAADFAMPLDDTQRTDEIGDLERAISSYRYAMAERLAMAQLVAEQHAHFQVVFDRAALGLCRLSLHGGFIDSNPALQSLLGYSTEQFEELNLHEIADAGERDRNREVFAAAAEGMARRISLETRLMASDGQFVWCALHGSAVRDGQGRPLYFVVLFEDVGDRKGQAMLLQHQAEHDALTGLPNRALFFDRLHKLLRTSPAEPFAVCIIDLDGFKQVNDEEGHQVGDRVLKLVAGRLRQKLRVTDTAARLGGDEFAAILPGADAAGARAVVDKLQAAMEPAFEINGRAVRLGASIGVAVHPVDGSSANELVRAADRAMYVAKRRRTKSTAASRAKARVG